jgi:hypothetical protein
MMSTKARNPEAENIQNGTAGNRSHVSEVKDVVEVEGRGEKIGNAS